MSIFNRDMAIEQLRKGHGRGGGVLEIPEGFTELSEDFALLFDWIPEENCFFPFREIRIPSTVQTINGITLTGYGPDEMPVKRFKKISVAKDNPYYMDVDGVLFSKDLKRLICYPCGKPEHTYVVPDTVEIIDEYAFQKNVNLRKVMLPTSLRRIEDGAFFHCVKLAIINLPESLEYIGEGCFELSFKIDRLVIPKNIKSIKTSFFAYASIVFIPNNSIELEYDSITTNYIDMFTGPAILSDGNEEIVDFAETYDYPHFENCFEDENGIIWADHGRVLISFPSDWKSEEYELPEEVEEIYLDAFKSSAVKRFYSKHNVSIVGEKIEDMYDIYGNDISIKGKHFHVFDGLISCDDKKVANQNLQERFADSTIDKKDNYVFISYSTKNKEEANAIRYYLEKNGINTWMAPYDIPPGNTYAKIINQAIQQCSCCVLVLSNESQQSMWVPREIERAINYHKILIPISIETVVLNDEFELYISTNQIVNVGKINDNSIEFQKILAVIKETLEKTIVSQSDPNTKEENQTGLFDTMFFGSYYYGNQGETAPIEWIILKEENGRKLLLSKYIIDVVDYHEKGQVQSWEECSIRTWLNTEFIKKSFSETEAACLIETRRDGTKNLFYQTEDLKQCEDKVFLLSVEEIKKYLGTDEAAMGPVTPYALEKGVFTQNAGLWWTCTPGDAFGMQTYIDTEGGIAYEGCYQQRREVGLRPAVWINEEESF